MLEGQAQITILLALWNGWRPVYDLSRVNPLCRMLRAHLRIPHRIALLTDFDADDSVEVDEIGPLPFEPRDVFSQHGINCFRRIRYFDPAFTRRFGTPWVMSMDLDTLIVDDCTAVVERMMCPYGFSIVRGRYYDRKAGQRPYNGGMYSIRVGEHARVWQSFDWQESPRECARSGWRGSDQVWISLTVPGAPTVGPEHGVYFLGQFCESSDDDPPPCIINYAGAMKPWSRMAQRDTPDLWDEYRRWQD